jgi:uracil-DNA glycosylase family 4
MAGLDKVHSQIRHCRKCRLWKSRKNAVPGEGNPHAEIMFIGQAPGRKEDETGRPFVGRAGKLLTELLTDIGIKRKDVFITSVIKCFPPKNRLPKSDEIVACNPYLQKQVALIKPKTIVLLGNVAIKTVLGDIGKLDKIHGKRIKRKGMTCIPTYHPAAAMRFPEIRRRIERDFKTLLNQ